MKTINVMYIIDFFYGRSGGGTETHLSYLLQLLNKERYKCIVVAFDVGDTPFVRNLKEKGIKIIHLPVARYYDMNAMKKALSLSSLIKHYNVDIVQTFHFKSDTYGAFVARVSGVKNIISSKRDVGDTKKKWHFILNRLCRYCFKGYIVVADKVAQIIFEKEHVQKSKIRKIYNGVDIKKFSPPNEKEKFTERIQLGLSINDFIIGMVAVFRPEKSHNIFFSSLGKCANKIPNLKVIVVGGGPLLKHYQEYYDNSLLKNKVIFVGPTQDVRKYLRVFDIGCLVPGSNEGFSNAILEKMSIGLPLIVTDVGGNSEAVIHNQNGIVIPPNNVEMLTRSIIDLYNDGEKRIKMGIESRKRAENHFSLEQMIKNHESYYEELLRS